MKRSKNGGIDLNNLHKDYHSTPDLQTQSGREKVEPDHDNASVTKDLDQFNRNAPRRIHSQEDLHLLSSKDSSGVSHHGNSNIHPAGYFTLPHKKSGASRSGPAPVHPPPPPPAPGTLLYMASRTNGSSDYAKVSPKTQEAPASSFNPSSSARLYESPKDVANIGYTDNVPTNNQTNGIKMKKSPTRTNSLPSRPRPMVLKRIEVSCGIKDSSKLFSPPFTNQSAESSDSLLRRKEVEWLMLYQYQSNGKSQIKLFISPLTTG